MIYYDMLLTTLFLELSKNFTQINQVIYAIMDESLSDDQALGNGPADSSASMTSMFNDPLKVGIATGTVGVAAGGATTYGVKQYIFDKDKNKLAEFSKLKQKTDPTDKEKERMKKLEEDKKIEEFVNAVQKPHNSAEEVNQLKEKIAALEAQLAEEKRKKPPIGGGSSSSSSGNKNPTTNLETQINNLKSELTAKQKIINDQEAEIAKLKKNPNGPISEADQTMFEMCLDNLTLIGNKKYFNTCLSFLKANKDAVEKADPNKMKALYQQLLNKDKVRTVDVLGEVVLKNGHRLVSETNYMEAQEEAKNMVVPSAEKLHAQLKEVMDELEKNLAAKTFLDDNPNTKTLIETCVKVKLIENAGNLDSIKNAAKKNNQASYSEPLFGINIKKDTQNQIANLLKELNPKKLLQEKKNQNIARKYLSVFLKSISTNPTNSSIGTKAKNNLLNDMKAENTGTILTALTINDTEGITAAQIIFSAAETDLEEPAKIISGFNNDMSKVEVAKEDDNFFNQISASTDIKFNLGKNPTTLGQVKIGEITMNDMNTTPADLHTLLGLNNKSDLKDDMIIFEENNIILYKITDLAKLEEILSIPCANMIETKNIKGYELKKDEIDSLLNNTIESDERRYKEASNAFKYTPEQIEAAENILNNDYQEASESPLEEEMLSFITNQLNDWMAKITDTPFAKVGTADATKIELNGTGTIIGNSLNDFLNSTKMTDKLYSKTINDLGGTLKLLDNLFTKTNVQYMVGFTKDTKEIKKYNELDDKSKDNICKKLKEHVLEGIDHIYDTEVKDFIKKDQDLLDLKKKLEGLTDPITIKKNDEIVKAALSQELLQINPEHYLSNGVLKQDNYSKIIDKDGKVLTSNLTDKANYIVTLKDSEAKLPSISLTKILAPINNNISISEDVRVEVVKLIADQIKTLVGDIAKDVDDINISLLQDNSDVQKVLLTVKKETTEKYIYLMNLLEVLKETLKKGTDVQAYKESIQNMFVDLKNTDSVNKLALFVKCYKEIKEMKVASSKIEIVLDKKIKPENAFNDAYKAEKKIKYDKDEAKYGLFKRINLNINGLYNATTTLQIKAVNTGNVFGNAQYKDNIADDDTTLILGTNGNQQNIGLVGFTANANADQYIKNLETVLLTYETTADKDTNKINNK